MSEMLIFLLAGLGLGVLIYRLITVFLWIYLDCDIELFLMSKFGTDISSLKGKVIWITGASSGIGRSLALLLASHGAKLAISARRLDELLKVKEECLQNFGGKVKDEDIFPLKIDLLEVEKHEEAFQKVLKHFGRLDILVNNAGRTQRASWLDIDLNVDKAVFDLNVFSPINLSRIAIRYFLEKGIKGHIAVTSSLAGLIVAPNMSSYVGSKAAINQYFRALNIEYPQIKNTLYCVGPVFTPLQEEAFTGRMHEKCGIPLPATVKRQTAERAAFLFAVAIANETSLNWTGLFPFTFLAYLREYPVLFNFALSLMNWKGVSKVE